jgi:hypothetical protein
LLINSSAAPIVLLTIKNNTLSLQVAPKQKKLGFMLPYSPLHYLLLQQFDTPLVLTSGNQSHHLFRSLAIKAKGLCFRCFLFRSVTTAELISAKQAKWNPPIPLIAIIFPPKRKRFY